MDSRVKAIVFACHPFLMSTGATYKRRCVMIEELTRNFAQPALSYNLSHREAQDIAMGMIGHRRVNHKIYGAEWERLSYPEDDALAWELATAWLKTKKEAA